MDAVRPSAGLRQRQRRRRPRWASGPGRSVGVQPTEGPPDRGTSRTRLSSSVPRADMLEAHRSSLLRSPLRASPPPRLGRTGSSSSTSATPASRQAPTATSRTRPTRPSRSARSCARCQRSTTRKGGSLESGAGRRAWSFCSTTSARQAGLCSSSTPKRASCSSSAEAMLAHVCPLLSRLPMLDAPR